MIIDSNNNRIRIILIVVIDRNESQRYRCGISRANSENRSSSRWCAFSLVDDDAFVGEKNTTPLDVSKADRKRKGTSTPENRNLVEPVLCDFARALAWKRRRAIRFIINLQNSFYVATRRRAVWVARRLPRRRRSIMWCFCVCVFYMYATMSV